MNNRELLDKMDGLLRQADFAENRIAAILTENQDLHARNKRLEINLRTQKKELDALKEAFKTLQLQRALSGHPDARHQAKLKINQFIREIDQCLAQLQE